MGAGWGSHAKGVLTIRRGRAGRDCHDRSQQETQRDPIWDGFGKWLGSLVDGSGAGGAVRKGVAGRAIGPGHERTGLSRASAGESVE